MAFILKLEIESARELKRVRVWVVRYTGISGEEWWMSGMVWLCDVERKERGER